MNFKRMAALTATAAIALTGCGGDDDKDSNRALSYDGFVAEANKICSEANDATDALDITPEATTENADKLNQGLEATRQARDDLEGLDAPDELASARDAFVAKVDEQNAVIERGATAAQSEDQEGYEAALGEANEIGKETDELGSKLGAAECAE
jgi:hypothetical protein